MMFSHRRWKQITSEAVQRINRLVQENLLKPKAYQGKPEQMAKILLAEDDSTMISLLKTLLKMEGFEVLALDVQSDVPAAVQREKPLALFMDVHLGGQSGMEILEAIRKNQELSEVRIVMTSGLNVKDECLSRGANAFLMKPFMPDDLLNLLK
jgi:CheY-like chemotaxis protein